MLPVSRQPDRAASNERPTLVSILSNLGWPLLLGLAATSVFYVLIYRGPLNQPWAHRYFASHPVTFFETGLFFVGLAALLMKMMEVGAQYVSLRSVRIEPAPLEGHSVDDCERLLEQLQQLPTNARQSHLARRLRDALLHVTRNGSAAELNDELKYLADLDAARQQEGYALVRIVIWATPMLGFLGTVMGITEALGDLSANAKMLSTSIDTAIQGLLGGLYVAFDTTALALTLSMILMFIQFLIDRVEQQLLSSVDVMANEELVGRFAVSPVSSDPQVAAVERLSHAVLRSVEQLVQRQAQLWQGTVEIAQGQWESLYVAAGDRVRESLEGALADSLREHSSQIERLGKSLSEPLERQWSDVQAGLHQQTVLLAAQMDELRRQGGVLSEAIRATGDVVNLERALNSNLASLAGSKNFEDTVMSLSAAIHLLTARLSVSADGRGPVDLSRSRSDGALSASGAGSSNGVATLTQEEEQALRGKAA